MSHASKHEYSAWIDVGGTFTDCYVLSPDEPRQRIKVLSSGLVPVSCARHSSANILLAPELAGDADNFWVGATVRCFNARRELVGDAHIVGSSPETDPLVGRLVLSEPIPAIEAAHHTPHAAEGLSFEIDCGLEAPVLAVRRLLGCPLASPLPPLSVRLGTTRGTNALLTRRGARTALAITAPFEDLLFIGDQTRPKLFELAIRRDEQLADTVVAISERLDAQGNILQPLDEAQASAGLKAARERGCDSLAICLMHSYRNPEHELRLEKLAREVGFAHISRSSHLAPLIEIVARARTTVVDAYLGPIVREYLERLVEQFGGTSQVQLQVMTSAGGLVDWRDMAGKDCVLSGPAGGAVALRSLAEATGLPMMIGLDMGGTSTDVCRAAAEQTLEYESTKAGVRILTPTLPIETVASGGGSICWFDGVSLRVGPQSAGAEPGPACYGRGGPLTITDLNVFLGRLPASQFPFPLDEPATVRRLEELNVQLQRAGINFDSLEKLAEGFRAIANQQMAEAARTISIAQGVDPRDDALVGFGGAAGQHICEIAELLGIGEIVDTIEAGLFSALGMGLAALRRDGTLPVYRDLSELDWDELGVRVEELLAELAAAWPQTTDAATLETRLWLELRYAGSDVPLAIAWNSGSHTLATQAQQVAERRFDQSADLAERFHAEHRRRFGYARPGRAIELVAVRAEMTLPSAVRLESARPVAEQPHRELPPANPEPLWSRGDWQTVPHCPRSRLTPGTRLAGPAIVLSPGSTLVIAADWQAETLADGSLYLTRAKPIAPTSENRANENKGSRKLEQAAPLPAIVCDDEAERDPVAEAVFAQRLAAIATQMGLVLQQTALSVNVKQRRDFSCAVFDARGRMLASAPHVPVHLGAMGATVRAVMERFPDLAPGEVVITNDPYQGGSHLPDVTVISGVYKEGQSQPAMFVANRAHHADIGGLAPGSMSVTATKLGEEGAIIEPLKLTAAECGELVRLRDVLSSAPWPPRNIEENLADIRAQLAANARGILLIGDLASRIGWIAISRLAQAVLCVAEQRVRNFIGTLSRETRQFADALDDGTVIAVSITPTADQRLRIDFSGTGPTSPTNFNANPSIVTAAMIYVLRCLIADDLPLNEGMLSAIDLHIPTGLLNPTRAADIGESPAVAAGNVETSQRVVDVLLGAFGAAAASQGTMNNFLFGNERFGFYETICGGAGATEGCPGASAVHTHMTNTRLTDPEVLEAKYPARLVQFGLRRGSGGSGKWPGGDGVIRTIEFLEPVEVSLLTSRRGPQRPYGLAGGQPGTAGTNTRIGCDGQRGELPAACHVALGAGEAIEIQTPGGGGYGAA